MANTPDSDVYPSVTYLNPLLFPLYVKTNDHVSIGVQARSDWLLSLFIEKLNNEIIDEIEEFSEQKQLINDILWNVRVFGWCVVQPYQNDVYRVFSSLEYEDWIKGNDEQNEKTTRIGVKVKYNDDLGNKWEDDIYFNDTEKEGKTLNKGYLFVWQNGNGRVLPNHPYLSSFALPDLSFGILALDIQIRQTQGTLHFNATNPFFYFFKYGDSITDKQRTDLISQMSYVNTSKALGAKESTLLDIIPIENGAIDKSIEALNHDLALFSGLTRLPLSFYLGERQQNGLGDTGEDTDIEKVIAKKQSILNHIIPELSVFLKEEFGINTDKVKDIYNNMKEELKQEKEDLMNKDEEKEDLMNKDEEINENGQKSKGIDKEQKPK